MIGIHKVALDLQSLGLAAGFHAQLRRFLEHAAAGLLDQLGAARGLDHGGTDQDGDDGQQAEAGEQGDFELDGEAAEQHFQDLFIGEALSAYRRGYGFL